MSDDYEIVSRKELDALKKEVSELKARPVQPPSADLMMALDRLSGHIQHLTKIFEHADKSIAEEYHSGVHKETQKLDLVIAQNEQLAKGLLHMSDLMQKQRKHETHKHYPLTQHEDFPAPPPLYENKHEAPEQKIPEPPKQDIAEEKIPEPPKKDDLPPPPNITPQDITQPEDTVEVETKPQLPDMPPPPQQSSIPKPEDEQMPTLPPPPGVEDAIQDDDVPPVIAPKQSRRSLMRSFR